MRPLLLSLALLYPVAASADGIAVHLDQPLGATTLRGGSTAVIAWSAESLPPGVEEWEAFLSVDGGAYYAARITPHLDISIREFRWTVPNVDTGNARILLRFGDERRETAVDVPQRFSIASSRAIPQFGRVVTRDSGEAARPGDRGVTTWVESDRRGRSLRPFATQSDSIQSVRSSEREHDEPESSEVFTLAPDDGATMAARPGRTSSIRGSLPVAPDPLLQSCRLNI